MYVELLATSSFLLLVVMPEAISSFLLLVVRCSKAPCYYICLSHCSPHLALPGVQAANRLKAQSSSTGTCNVHGSIRKEIEVTSESKQSAPVQLPCRRS